MTIKEFRLLDIDVYDGEKLVYSGACEAAPEEMKNSQIKIIKAEGKKIIVKLEA